MRVKFITYPLLLLPLSWIHGLGKALGILGYYCIPHYRKRALSNLALAKTLHLTNDEIIRTAKKSFQNLAINCLEYPRLKTCNNYRCINPEIADELHAKGQGIIFFCAHQANWEMLFLDGTSRMKGVAIGKETKNKSLYRWIVEIREKNGGKIIDMKNALREGANCLKRGDFLGIVADRGMPNSAYSFPFFGRPAKLTTAPAFLAYKTNSPIIFAENRRVGTEYHIRYSEPLWPDLTKPIDEEMPRLMNHLFSQLEESIRAAPDQWLWQHNFWKRQTPKNFYKPFRQDSLCIAIPAAFPEEPLATLRELYPTEYLILLAPEGYLPRIAVDELIHYRNESELFRDDYRCKLLFNFTPTPLHRHYLARSAFEVLDLANIYKLAAKYREPHHTLSDIIKRAICRPKTWRFHAS